MSGLGRIVYGGDESRNNRIKRGKAQLKEKQSGRKDSAAKTKDCAGRIYKRFERAGRFGTGCGMRSDFEEALGACYYEWKKQQGMEAEEAFANIVLSGYYANDKIRSKLQDFCEYVEQELEGEETSENVVLCGFNTCMNLVWLDYQGMKRRLQESEASYKGARKDASMTAFLHELAYMNEGLDNLYQTCLLVKEVSRKSAMAYSDRKLYARLYKADAEIQGYNRHSDAFGFQPILEDLERRKDKKRGEIEEAKRLKTALDDLMQESDLLAMKDRESELDVLQSRYRKMSEKARSILNQYKHE